MKKPIYKKLWFQIVAGLFVIGFIGNLFSATSSDGESKPSSDRQPAETSQSTEGNLDDVTGSEPTGATADDAESSIATESPTQVQEPKKVSSSSSASNLSALLSQLSVAPESNDGYDRSLFKHWIDADGDGCDARDEVLIAESITQVSVGSGCSIRGGTWVSAFDLMETRNPSDFDIDHLVPLKEAWGSGAWQWDSTTREAFANDLDFDLSLIAVSASSNRSKSDRDPAEWLPKNTDYWCAYAVSWVQVKIRWNLSIDQAEKSKLSDLAESCGNLALDFAPAASVSTATPTPSATPTPTPTPTQSSGCSAGQVDINSADKESLMRIIHIATSRADEIILRRASTPFKSVDGLDDISGIGASRLADIKSEGLACVK